MEMLSIQEKLMCYRIGWETEAYARLAIKKIMWEATRLNDLVTAVTTEGGTETACVNIPRPEKNGGKFELPFFEHPHVLYAKIWRWPDARKEDLKHRDNCKFGFDLGKKIVCVNPYHYDRIVLVPTSFQSTSTNTAQNQILTDAEKPECEPLEKVNAAPLSSASTAVIASACDKPSDSNTSTSSFGSFDQEPAKLSDVPSSDPSSEKELNLRTLLTAMDSVDRSAKDNADDSSTRKKRDSTSSSTSTDDGFEIVNYDMDIEELENGAPSKDNSTSCLSTKDQDITKEVGDEMTIKSEYEVASIDGHHTTLKESGQSTEDELPMLVNHFITDVEDRKPLENCGVTAPEKNIVQENTIKMETENEESKDVFEIVSTDGWKNKYEKLKTAFVEVVFAATDPSAEVRCKEVLKVMNDVQNEFRGESASSKQYEFLKAFLNSGSCTVMSGTGVTPGSSSASTNTPYRRKVKPNLVSSIRKKNQTCTPPSFDSTDAGPSGISAKTHTTVTFPIPMTPPDFSLPKNSFGWDSREPIPTVTIEHRAVPISSQVQEQSKINEVTNQGLRHDQVLKDDAEKARLRDELAVLRKRVQSLETQAQVQKQDEYDKMVLYTNSMRDQYIKTVHRLTELNRVLTEKVTQKDAEIASLSRTFDALEIPSLLDEKDREIDALNDHLLALSAILTNNEEEIQSLKNEKRSLKRNSDAEETAQEISSKRRPDSQAETESNENPLTPQHVFDSLCVELEKSNLEKSQENKSSSDLPNKEDVSPNNVPDQDDSTSSFVSQKIDTLTSSLELFQIKEKEQGAMTAKLTEMIAEMQVMKITHDKTKSDLEARLKNGAKQYAKLYVKYDRMVRNSQAQD